MPGSFSHQSRRSRRVYFALDNNTELLVLKTKEERRSTWYNSEDKAAFRKNALRDAQFFRHLREKTPDADLSLYDNRICSWGLEKNISEKTALKTVELKKRVVEAVLTIQTLQGRHKTPVDNPYAVATHELNKFSSDRALKFGAFRQKRVRELYEEMSLTSFPDMSRVRSFSRMRNTACGTEIKEANAVSSLSRRRAHCQ